jgi:excisionase family DNA binding protein
MSDSRLSVAEAARIVGRSPDTVRRAIQSGALEAERVGVRGWYLVDAADVEALVTKSRAGGDAAGGAAGGSENDLAKSA